MEKLVHKEAIVRGGVDCVERGERPLVNYEHLAKPLLSCYLQFANDFPVHVPNFLLPLSLLQMHNNCCPEAKVTKLL